MKQPRGGAGADLIFFIFFLILLGIVWAVSGGPERASSTSGPFFSFPFGNNSVPGVPLPDANSDNTSSNNKPSNNELLPTERLSPYAGLVQLSGGRARESQAEREYVQIRASGTFTNPIPISTWRIESSVTGQGAVLGNVALLPVPSGGSQESPLVLAPGATLFVATGRSPIGVSFRTNLCTGYFEQSQDFQPSLKKECPRPADELTKANISPNASCSNFVEDMRRCEFASAVPGDVGSACRAFIQDTLTYSGCVATHKSEENFFRNEWRVYLNRPNELWDNTDERIRLLDENGFLVDAVSY